MTALRQPDYEVAAFEADVACEVEACGRTTRQHFWDSARKLFTCRECCPSTDGPVTVEMGDAESVRDQVPQGESGEDRGGRSAA